MPETETPRQPDGRAHNARPDAEPRATYGEQSDLDAPTDSIAYAYARDLAAHGE